MSIHRLISSLIGITAAPAIVFLSSCHMESPSMDDLECGFVNVPDSVRVACYWYWLSGHISEEGIVKDLQAMRDAGITRAYIGNIGLKGGEYGDVRMFSDEWWRLLRVALKTASDYGIETGIFNCAGWSQSGGPWVTPEKSMRFIRSSSVRLNGGDFWNGIIPEYSDSMQLVKALAYPCEERNPDKSWTIVHHDGQETTLDMCMDDGQKVRSLIIRPSGRVMCHAELLADEEGKFRSIRKFIIDRTNFSTSVGFIPDAPVVISVPETSSDKFRLSLGKPEAIDKTSKITVTLSTEPMVERWPEKSLAKMYQRPDPKWDSYIWPLEPDYGGTDSAAVRSAQVLDVTGSVSDKGELVWKVPDGLWTLSAYYMQSTGMTNSPAPPEATGLEVDKMSRRHVGFHYDSFVGELLRRIPENDRRGLKVVVQDSYETGSQNWTDGMLDSFKVKFNYDPTPFLPVLDGHVVDNEDVSSRFLWDLRRFVADAVADNYVGELTRLSHRDGLTTWLENYGHWGFPGEFLQYGGRADEVSGEFWNKGELGLIENRCASSCGHTYGKKRIWAESCTSGKPAFTNYPGNMKARVDRFFTEGINASLLHVYIHQPYENLNPGMNAWFGTEFNRKNTWFCCMGMFTDYLKRCGFLLQQGMYVADVAYFIGEDTPKMTGPVTDGLPKGYSFDYINSEILMTKADVRNGRLVLPDGMSYRLLVLPEQKTMRPGLLQKILGFAKEGLAVYGKAPVLSPSLEGYPEADKIVKALGEELFPGDKYGNGNIFHNDMCLKDVLDKMGVTPDFQCADANDSILFIHRSMPDVEIYFLSNQSGKRQAFDGIFRVARDFSPEIWTPVDGQRYGVREYSWLGNGMSVPIDLEADESVFVVFRKHKNGRMKPLRAGIKDTLLCVEGPWRVTFTRDSVPGNTKVFNKLTDWKESGDTDVRFYSGEAVYVNKFMMNHLPSGQLWLDLGKVMLMAKVYLNGKYVGGVWTPPYRVDVSDALKEGENTLAVRVYNGWRNRLIGDSALPPERRVTWVLNNSLTADSPLQSSGLLGPVCVLKEGLE